MDKLLTLKECAEILGTTEKGIYMRVFRGFIPYVKLGSAQKSPIRIEQSALEAYIAQNRVEAFRAKEVQ